MATFGLVHGAYHGPWCWARLLPALEHLGHTGLTVDLPCDDPSAGASEYAAMALEAFAGAPDDLVLVGHSLGGLSIPVIAGLRPVSTLVFLCAMLPRPGRSLDQVMKEEPDMVGSLVAEGGAYTDAAGATHWVPEAAARLFFSDCDERTAAWAAARLRGQFWKISEEVTPLQSWPDVPAVSIIGAHDLVINPGWSRRVSPSVVGTPVLELECGHAPFLSVPEELARMLADLA